MSDEYDLDEQLKEWYGDSPLSDRDLGFGSMQTGDCPMFSADWVRSETFDESWKALEEFTGHSPRRFLQQVEPVQVDRKLLGPSLLEVALRARPAMEEHKQSKSNKQGILAWLRSLWKK